MMNISKTFNRGQKVFVVDPDLEQPVITGATYVSQDEKTGDHLVVLDYEEGAQRRIADMQIAACRTGLQLRLVP